MDTELLRTLASEKHTVREISTITGKSPSTIRYWIKKQGVKLFRGPGGKLPRDAKKALGCKCKCGETRPEKFYGNKRSICGKCHNEYTLTYGQKQKNRVREFLGGRCIECGYSRFKCALDVHHLDPTKKDPNFASSRGWAWERIEKELKNCVLLCRCCHAAVHAGELKLKSGIALGVGD